MSIAIPAAIYGDVPQHRRPWAVKGAAPLFILLRYDVDHFHRLALH